MIRFDASSTVRSYAGESVTDLAALDPAGIMNPGGLRP